MPRPFIGREADKRASIIRLPAFALAFRIASRLMTSDLLMR
jgi:hypothetical protein